jgi:hypothetical protein
MRAIAFVALLAACASSSAPKPDDLPRTHAMYDGSRPPPLEKMAVLCVFSPASEDGKTLVGRITSDDTGEDYRPSLDTRILALEPGRYRLETYFWIARSRLEDGKLVIENLQSGQIAPMEIVVEAGRTYFVRAELGKKDEVRAQERGGFFRLNYGATVADPERLRRGDSSSLAASEYVWRPHLTVLPPAQAAEYRGYR